MFRLEDADTSKAIDRCRALHPTVRVVAFGQYTVTGSKGSIYTVHCYRDAQGFKTVDCNCQTRDGVACKHGVAAVAMHIYLATIQMIAARRVRRLARLSR